MSDTEISELRGEVQSLRGLLTLALIVLFIFTVPVNLFLYRQAKALGTQAQNAQNVVAGYSDGGEAKVLDFWNKLKDYTVSHPDFQPVINKYSQYFGSAKAPSPAPAPVAAPKKR